MDIESGNPESSTSISFSNQVTYTTTYAALFDQDKLSINGELVVNGRDILAELEELKKELKELREFKLKAKLKFGSDNIRDLDI